jgi:thymidine kinase
MFCSKTTTLLSYIRKYTIAKKKVLVINFIRDTRYLSTDLEKAIVSHDNASYEVDYMCEKLSEIPEEKISISDVIVIDEGAFFDDLIPFADSWANRGKIVVVAGLDGTYKREPFPNIANLICKAEEVHKLSAVCTVCGDDAHFTKRIVDSEEAILIGGTDAYEARCRGCFEKP